LQGKISEKEMIENSIKEIQDYAKKQLNWFKKDKRAKWINNYREAEKLVRDYLEN
jgi:tRNA dimethylallyltransferase